MKHTKIIQSFTQIRMTGKYSKILLDMKAEIKDSSHLSKDFLNYLLIIFTLSY